ncbi:hypothetical protein DMENIID0001_037210 [Sergentomyia squamirostris]
MCDGDKVFHEEKHEGKIFNQLRFGTCCSASKAAKEAPGRGALEASVAASSGYVYKEVTACFFGDHCPLQSVPIRAEEHEHLGAEMLYLNIGLSVPEQLLPPSPNFFFEELSSFSHYRGCILGRGKHFGCLRDNLDEGGPEEQSQEDRGALHKNWMHTPRYATMLKRK